jgi:antitoxin component of RelBE/YafQ-DinJ toxin-antitoxin module
MGEETKLTIRISKELLETAKRKAREQDLTISQVVRRALRELVGDPSEEPPPKEP